MADLDTEEQPSWLTQEFLENILRDRNSDPSIVISALDIKPAVSKGENFISYMLRIKIRYSGYNSQENSEISLICKTNNDDDYANKVLKTYNVYEQELMMYENYLPGFEKLLKSANINSDLAPRAFTVNFKENVMIFEDLCQIGYSMAQRCNGLNRDHALLVLDKLAKFHATSVVFNQQNDNVLQKYFTKGQINEDCTEIEDFYVENTKMLANEIATWPGYEYYAKKILRLTNTIARRAKEAFDPKQSDFNVLNHGDVWVNNLMFKYDLGTPTKPTNVILIDFQFNKWASPALDLLYFMATSLTDDLREHCEDEFIQYYHERLMKNFKSFKYCGNVPTLHEFQQQILKHYMYSFMSTMIVLPFMMSKHTGEFDFRTLMGKDERSPALQKLLYQNEDFHKIAKRALRVFDQKGILDM